MFVEFKSAQWERAIGDVLDGSADLGFAETTGATDNRDLQVQAGQKILGFFLLHPQPSSRREGAPRPRGFARIPLGRLPPCQTAIAPACPPTISDLRSSTQTGIAFDRAPSSGSFTAAKQDRSWRTGFERGDPQSGRARAERRAFRPASVLRAPWLSINYGFITKRGRTPSPAAKAFNDDRPLDRKRDSSVVASCAGERPAQTGDRQATCFFDRAAITGHR